MRVLVVYLAVAWVILQLTSLLREELQLPRWVTPSALLLLLVGLVLVCVTVWVQELADRRRTRLYGRPSMQVGHRETLIEEAPHGELRSADAGAGHELSAGGGADGISTGTATAPVSQSHGLEAEVIRPGWRFSNLTWGRFALVALIAFALLFGLAGAFVVVRQGTGGLGPRVAKAEAAPGIAVLPFRVSGRDLDVWREGMVDLLSTNLDEVAALRAIDSRTVLARWRERVKGEGGDDLATALDVARRAGARYALVGSAVSIGKDVRLVAEIYDVNGGESLWQGQVEGSPDKVLELVDRLSLDILRALVAEEQGTIHVNLANVTTSSVPALKAYLEGESLLRRSDFKAAIPAFERAVAADSSFALAYFRLSTAYGWEQGLNAPANLENVEHAARFIDRLPERERVLVRGGLALDRGTLDGIEPLKEATHRFPDDAEIWYLLGDTYFHFWGDALVSRSSSDSAFTRTIELDPTFSPAYIHLIENAFIEADSARLVRLVAAYDTLAYGASERFKLRNHLAFMLTYGGEVSREAARAQLDTLPSHDVGSVMSVLRHPRFIAEAERLAEILARRSDAVGRQIGSTTKFFIGLGRGKLQDAREALDTDPGLKPFASVVLYTMTQFGAPMDTLQLERELGVPPDTSAVDVAQFYGRGLNVFYTGAYAADMGRWPVSEAARERLRSYAKEFLIVGDSTSARFAEAAAQALEGYALWKRGQPEQGLALLQRAQQNATSAARTDVNPLIRWWLAELLLDQGRPREAKVYLLTLVDNPMARFHLAKVHEQLGEFAEAREQYELFARALWEADPELKPAVDEGVNAAKRLRSVVRE